MPRVPPYRRSSSLVLYWDEERLIAHNYRSRARLVVDPLLVPVLHAFPRIELPPGVIAKLAAKTLLERHASGRRPRGAGWHDWGPLAAAYHYGTKDVPWSTNPRRGEERLRERAQHTPMPPALKKPPRRAQIAPLPPVQREGPFVETLLARRTWRDFGRGAVSLDHVATLLGLTWGVQQWGIVRGQGRVALKTSPSGGACHPGEVYLLALRVAGLQPGLYHYQPDRHALVLVRKGATRRDIGRYIPGQSWYRSAAALFLMTAVFQREQWRYATPRAYRTLLLDAGHLCQTFCLIATSLQLAPFCTAALADSVIERDLGIDGVSEGALYLAGVGTRPRGGWRPGVPGLRQ